MSILFRLSDRSDIQQMQIVRHLVEENKLSNPDLVTDQDVEHYITKKGRGWVCEVEGNVIGFAIVDLADKNVWALFVDPKFAEQGIGKELHRIMVNWYFEQTNDNLTLSTAKNTRAEQFYTLQGWTATGHDPNGEIQFELDYHTWVQRAGK